MNSIKTKSNDRIIQFNSNYESLMVVFQLPRLESRGN